MVSLLIRYRSRIYSTDAIDQAFRFKELLTCIFVDLDRLIASSGLTDSEKLVCDLAMKGYTAQDIEETQGLSRQAAQTMIQRASEKISSRQAAQWEDHINQHYKNQPFYLLDSSRHRDGHMACSQKSNLAGVIVGGSFSSEQSRS